MPRFTLPAARRAVARRAVRHTPARTFSHPAATLAVAALFTACASAGGAGGGGSGGGSGSGSAYTFAPSLGINLAEMTQRPSGLYVREIAPGSGNPAISGDFVRIEYTLHLANGTLVDAAYAAQPFEFQLGQRAVIAGMEEAITGMRPGGRRRIVVPPSLGYGMRTRGQIPSGSVLVYELHVLYVGR